MSGRQQYVRIGVEALSLGAIPHGVPQGSILSPALFTIYIPKFGSLESHVDDSKLYLSFSFKDTYSVVQRMNDDYRRLRLDAAIVIIYIYNYLMYTVGVLVFKCDKGLAPSYLSDRFVTRSTVHDRNTRNKDYLNIPAYQSAAGQRTFIQLFRERLSEKMCTRQSRKVIWEMINTLFLTTVAIEPTFVAFL